VRVAISLAYSGLVFIAASLTAARALGCSPAEPPHPFVATENPSDVAPPVLKTAQLDVRRAKEPGSSGDGDCGELGGYTFHVDAADDITAPEDLAYSLKLVKGSLPFAIPDQPVRVTFGRRPGRLSSWFSDSGKEFDAVVEVAMMDEAGNLSEPVEVHASGDAVGCGCTVPSAHRGNVASGLAVAALLLVRRLRRFVRYCPASN